MSDAATTSPARLTGTQRKHLRGLAHALEPVVHVGRSGTTERVFSAVRPARADH
jgi:RNA-binding protein YhbY